MKQPIRKKNAIKCFVVFSIFFFIADLVYKTFNNITYLNRENCILYRMLPKVGFLFFEYFIELFLIVVVGIFLAVLLEAYFVKYRRFYPTNSITAFFYASLLPVCACTTIPLITSMREKLTFRTIITFVVAAPLLSPYIIALSFSVLGTTYGILRIVSSFLLAIVSGFVLEFFYSKEDLGEWIVVSTCNPHEGTPEKGDVYLKTYEVFKKILPYLIVAGAAGILIELAAPANFLKNHTISNNITAVMVAVLVGIPVYLCHGAEVLFLRPLIHQGGLFLGTAMAFSLASTSICITSFVMLIKFMGKKLTIILLTNLIIATLILGVLLNAVVPEISFPPK